MALGNALIKLQRDLKREFNRRAYAVTRNAALNIVNDLQRKGPYWDGLFYNAWEVRPGDVTIPADQEGTMSRSKDPKPKPTAGAFKLSDIPEQRVDYRSVPSLTIGNRMVYRDIALDLEPGRIKQEGGGTAPQDWYVTYYGGGEMDRAVKDAIKKNINLPGE